MSALRLQRRQRHQGMRCLRSIHHRLLLLLPSPHHLPLRRRRRLHPARGGLRPGGGLVRQLLRAVLFVCGAHLRLSGHLCGLKHPAAHVPQEHRQAGGAHELRRSRGLHYGQNLPVLLRDHGHHRTAGLRYLHQHPRIHPINAHLRRTLQRLHEGVVRQHRLLPDEHLHPGRLLPPRRIPPRLPGYQAGEPLVPPRTSQEPQIHLYRDAARPEHARSGAYLRLHHAHRAPSHAALLRDDLCARAAAADAPHVRDLHPLLPYRQVAPLPLLPKAPPAGRRRHQTGDISAPLRGHHSPRLCLLDVQQHRHNPLRRCPGPRPGGQYRRPALSEQRHTPLGAAAAAVRPQGGGETAQVPAHLLDLQVRSHPLQRDHEVLKPHALRGRRQGRGAPLGAAAHE
mmetsp:Transcript_19478/g.43401  ORF Transcript_19478/g.43401 Transcript_19478/m.43401 type:complete len:397 (-) Transcript_19478:1267-2457(-)